MAENVKRKIVKNVYWAIAGKMANLFSGLVVGIMVARYLGPEQYGLMNYVISYVFLFQTISCFGLDQIEIREESKGRMPYQTVIGTSAIIRIVLAVIFMMLVVLTSWQFDADAFTTLLVFIYSLSIPLNCCMVIRNYFTAIVQNEYVVKVEIGRTLLGVAIKLLLLWLDATLVWFIVFSTFDFVLTASGYIAAYHTKVGRMSEWNFDRQCARYMLKEAFPLLLTNTAVIVYQRIDQVMIGQLIDKESVGYFSVASRFVEVLMYIPMILSQTVMPVLVQKLNEGKEAYERSAQQFMNMSIWCSFIASVFTSLIAYWLVTLLFGEAYMPAVIILQIMSFKAASVALSNTAGAMLVAEGLQKYAIFRDAFGCLVCVVLNYLLLPRYGVVAAAYVAILSTIAAGYVADAFIPAYRHLFIRQTKALLFGWKDVHHVKSIIS